jgi:hypothetical protein
MESKTMLLGLQFQRGLQHADSKDLRVSTHTRHMRLWILPCRTLSLCFLSPLISSFKRLDVLGFQPMDNYSLKSNFHKG